MIYGSNNNTQECELCLVIANLTLENTQFINTTLHIVEDVVDDLCLGIGGEIIYNECTTIFNLFQMIFNNITNSFTNPMLLCQKLFMCPSLKK
jgi:hypothetical protein